MRDASDELALKVTTSMGSDKSNFSDESTWLSIPYPKLKFQSVYRNISFIARVSHCLL